MNRQAKRDPTDPARRALRAAPLRSLPRLPQHHHLITTCLHSHPSLCGSTEGPNVQSQKSPNPLSLQVDGLESLRGPLGDVLRRVPLLLAGHQANFISAFSLTHVSVMP